LLRCLGGSATLTATPLKAAEKLPLAKSRLFDGRSKGRDTLQLCCFLLSGEIRRYGNAEGKG
jgi:hypothetical protein